MEIRRFGEGRAEEKTVLDRVLRKARIEEWNVWWLGNSLRNEVRRWQETDLCCQKAVMR